MSTTITTGEARLSYVHLTQPHASMPGQAPKYSVAVLIPKSDVQTKALIDAAVQEATQNGIAGKWGGSAPAMVKTTLHDGDGVKDNGEAYGDECKGHWVLNCNASESHKPSVVDLQLQPIIDASEIYSGMYGRVNVNFYPFNFNGRKAIGCGLNHVQKTRDGEALGGGSVSVESAFGAPVAPTAPAQGVGVTINPITGQPM